MWPLYLMLGMFGLVGLIAAWEKFELPGSISWRAQRSLRREMARVGRAPTAQLVSEARTAIRYERWERFRPARALLENDQWTDEDLLRVLNELFAAVSEDDRPHGRAGPGSAVFEFYDCGLATILEAIEKRRSPPGGTQA